MPVIINDFEMVATTPPSSSNRPSAQQEPNPQPPPKPPRLRPEDIERIQWRQQLRLARIRAD